MKKSVSIYQRANKIFLVPVGRTSTGLGLETEPVQTFLSNVSESDIGNGILQAISQSGKAVAQPSWNEFSSPVEKAAGVKNWNEFVGGTKAAALDLMDSGYVITPLRPAHRGNFEFVKDVSITLPPNSSAEELAKNLFTILENTEEYPLRKKGQQTQNN
ncbi:hypothetical protein L0244_33655 [bacterium]|nr:hypothetical protein [bacterium]MCI0617946.1 hypothetical protein [bacterium]